MRNFLVSILRSIEKGLSENPYIIRWWTRYPRLSSFLQKRLTVRSRYGFFFSLGVLISLFIFSYFLKTANILFRNPLETPDIRIANLFLVYRHPAVEQILLFFTHLAHWQTICSLGAIVLLLLLLQKRKREAWFFFGGVAMSGLILLLFKSFFQRSRPDEIYALLVEHSHSFPSGHATLSVVFYGLIAYGLIRQTNKRARKELIGLGAILLIFTIGLSRVYLGVHWTSDVIGGWYLGSALLVFIITLFKERERSVPLIRETSPTNKKIKSLALVLLLLEFEFVFLLFQNQPLLELPQQQTISFNLSTTTSSSLETTILNNNFPKFSETLTGEKMSPVSFVVVGSEEKIITAFKTAGWFLAEKPNLGNLLYLAYAAITNKPYPTAPVTPTFLDAQPEDMAFQKATEANSVKERHHTRFWKTNFSFENQPLWIATASFDAGLRYFITHRIAPDIDTERDYIKNDLMQTGMIHEIKEVQLVRPVLGKNQIGDQFFTNGRAYLIILK